MCLSGKGEGPVTRPAQVLAKLRERGYVPLARAIAEHHGVTLTEMLGTAKTPAPRMARQRMWYALRIFGWSYPRIGKLFGRAHTTILDGVRAHEARVSGSLSTTKDVLPLQDADTLPDMLSREGHLTILRVEGA